MFVPSRNLGKRLLGTIGSWRWIVILSAIFLHLKKTPITEIGRSRLHGSLAAEQMTGIGVGQASIQI